MVSQPVRPASLSESAGLASTLFIVFAQNSDDIIVTSQTREQGMMECAVSSSLFSVYVIKKRVH